MCGRSKELRISTAAVILLALSGLQAGAQEMPPGVEPPLADAGNWAADFNNAMVACFQGSMDSCDAIWRSDRVLMDTLLWQYGRSCGGRVDLEELRAAGAFRLGGPSLFCVEIFPDSE
jgi:hypothetical protein